MTTPNDELTKPAVEAETEAEGLEAPEPGGWGDYPLDELAIREEKRTAVDVVRRIGSGRFILDPDFQRGFVWDTKRQSRLIESILLRIPLPVFYVAEDAEGRLIVVDGRQRLTTLDRFWKNELKLELPERDELHHKRFQDLEGRLKDRIEDCQMLFYIIDNKVPERARLDIFERVNGGEVLTRQQMRNAIYQGPATTFLREEAESELFIEATGRSLNRKRMLDREFVNRFCAFSLLSLDIYKGDMDDWLGRALDRLNRDPSLVQGTRERLRRTLGNNLAVFGKHAFRKHEKGQSKRSLVNAALFDVMSTGLADRDPALVSERAEALRQAFYARMGDARFIKAITYGPNTPSEVRARFEIAEAMFREAFDAH